ncbi:hypothetical protein L208DRAFT_1395465 [Tricholoma matsutake]|nr:hypothetical protein L208DRAFT_1395465 [Tricholoma matsutake 945]
MPKFIPSVLKRLVKPRSPGLQPNSSLVQQQQQSLRIPIPNPTASLARHPLTDRPEIEAASYNPATSVEAPASNAIESCSETAPMSPSAAKATAVNALKLLLKISSDIPGPGIKVALVGLLTIIERVQETSDNIQGFRTLATQMKDLQPIFSKVKEMEIAGASADIVDFLRKLEVCMSGDIH